MFLLRDVFDYPYDRIAEIVGRSEDATRQLAVRARREVERGRPRFETEPEQEERLAASFFAAAEEGDLGALEALLAADVELHGDGGGKVRRSPARSKAAQRVARTLAAWARAGARFGGFTSQPDPGQRRPGRDLSRSRRQGPQRPGARDRGRQVRRVNSIVNPDKLGHLGPVADMNELLGSCGAAIEPADRRSGILSPAPSASIRSPELVGGRDRGQHRAA